MAHVKMIESQVTDKSVFDIMISKASKPLFKTQKQNEQAKKTKEIVKTLSKKAKKTKEIVKTLSKKAKKNKMVVRSRTWAETSHCYEKYPGLMIPPKVVGDYYCST